MSLIQNFFFSSLLFIFIVKPLSAQDKKVSKDSLESLFNNSITLFNDYNYHEGIQTSMRLIELAELVESNYFLYHGHNNLGVAYEELGDTMRAKTHYEKSLVFAKATQNDTLIMWSYNNMGNIFSYVSSPVAVYPTSSRSAPTSRRPLPVCHWTAARFCRST